MNDALTLKDIERFCAKVTFTASRCIEWSGAKDKKGYGVFRAGKMQFAHRVSFQMFNGPIPPGMSVLHRCDNPRCVNPAHLFVGTQQDNMADKQAKGRVLTGNRHQNSKIKESDAGTIRRLFAGGMRQHEIASQFGISQSQVSHIVTLKRRRNQ